MATIKKVRKAQTGKTLKYNELEKRLMQAEKKDSINQRKSYTNQRANKVIGKNKTGGKVTKAQTGKKLDSKYFEESRKKVKAVTDSAKLQEIKKGINTYDDYLKSKVKAKPKAKMGMKVGSKMSKATHGTKISKSTKKK